jgi:RimJ/RimL family protein N-acetyltransferase
VLHPGYPIRTDRLDLRPFTARDFEDVLAIRSRPGVARYLPAGVLGPEEVRQLLRRVAGQVALVREGDELALAVVRRDTGTVIGDVVLALRSVEHRMAEIGFVFHPDHHGQGYAREASVALLRLGFDHFGLHRIIGRCDARNRPSAGLMERLGMRREAHFVQNELIKGEWTDELVYAILDSEWAARPEEWS